MANRYWVGGSGTWNTSSTTNWSTSSGGASGASVPTGADAVIVDANSGSPTITLTGALDALSLTTTGATCTFTSTGTLTLGNTAGTTSNNTIVLSATTTWSATGLLSIGSYSGTIPTTKYIDTNGITFNCSIQCIVSNIADVTFVLSSNLVLNSTSTLTIGETFNANNYNVTAGLVAIPTNGNSTTVTMGSGTWTLTGVGSVWNVDSAPSPATIVANTSTIVLSDISTSARSFIGADKTYYNLVIGGTTGTSTLTFTGSNTFNSISSTKTVAHTIQFTAGTTTTTNVWSVTGTSGNVVTVKSVTNASHTLTSSNNVLVSADYLNISYSAASPSNVWFAGNNSTNGGNNSGWNFTSPNSGFFLVF
jgi:hypothetical protein